MMKKICDTITKLGFGIMGISLGSVLIGIGGLFVGASINYVVIPALVGVASLTVAISSQLTLLLVKKEKYFDDCIIYEMDRNICKEDSDNLEIEKENAQVISCEKSKGKNSFERNESINNQVSCINKNDEYYEALFSIDVDYSDDIIFDKPKVRSIGVKE